MEGILPDRYGVSLFNLGAGAAKDISIEWKFAIGDIVRQTNQLSQRSFAESYFQHDTSKQTLSLEAKTGLRATYFLKNDLHSRHDYILPCSIENKGHKVFLPGSYIDLVSSYLYLAFAQKETPQDLDDSLFEIEAFCKVCYSRRFKLRIELMVYRSSEPPAFDALLVPVA
jgi:hypothetical protein